ncbi:MAG TPA: siderophore-interacting protein [Acidimicrobiales bacterium]|nr:siderophore-interacting protein [Acidimicrobiales bacterium]
MTGPADPAPIRREPPAFREVTVAAVVERTPHLRRVHLSGAGLLGFRVDEPGASVRLLLRRAGVLELPEWTGNEFRFVDGARPPIRTLTPLRADPVAATLDVEVVIHADVPGPLSEWARTTEPGDTVAVSGPGRGYPVDPAVRRYLVAGDESALPAIEQLLEVLPPDATVDVVIEVAHPDARLELPDHPGATVAWLDLPPGRRPGDALVEAVTTRAIDPEGRVWAAGEAAAVQRIRKHLEAVGIPRPRTTVRGYWKHGRAVGG